MTRELLSPAVLARLKATTARRFQRAAEIDAAWAGRRRPRCGDIGEPVKRIELEPLPEGVPEPIRTPAPAPTEPEKEPQHV